MEVLGSEWYLAPGAKLELVEIVRDKHSSPFGRNLRGVGLSGQCLIREVGRSLYLYATHQQRKLTLSVDLTYHVSRR